MRWNLQFPGASEPVAAHDLIGINSPVLGWFELSAALLYTTDSVPELDFERLERHLGFRAPLMATRREHTLQFGKTCET